MRTFKALAILILLISLTRAAMGQTNLVWQAGKVLDPTTINATEFDQYFAAAPISDAVFKRIWLKSFKEDCSIKRDELRYLRVLHANKEGLPQMGEIICNKAIANDLLYIFRKLYEANYRIERMVLIDEYDADDEKSMSANNTTCFNFRKVSGSTKLSKHSYGLAIDINPRINPYVRTRAGKIEPANGKDYAYKRTNKPGQALLFINRSDLCYKLFTERGFIWGGSWKYNIDYQHFQKNP